MPSRLIRDEILDSERVQTLPLEARWLFVSILLTADDVGLFEVATFKLGRRAGLEIKTVSMLIQLLADADLIRIYFHEGKQYGFIPRFRQRLQIKRSRYPAPPLALIQDDTDASRKINDLASNPPLDNCASRKSTAVQQPEPEPEPEILKDIEPSALVAKGDAYRVPNCPFEGLTELYHKLCPSLPRLRIMTNMRLKHTQARWKQVCANDKCTAEDALKTFHWYFERAEASDFLTGRSSGRNGRAWKADFDWLMKPESFAKVVEGRYQGEAA